MPGGKSAHLKECLKGEFIGIDFDLKEELSDFINYEWEAFKKKFKPYYKNLNPEKSNIAIGLHAGSVHAVCVYLSKGDIILCPDGNGLYHVGEISSDYYFAKGEVLQLMCVDQVETNIEDYLRVIQYKTATLFEALCECTAVLAGCDASIRKNLAMYGRNIGLAFQISDDVLDYTAESFEQIGKNIGDDLSGGKITLPFIYAFNNSPENKKEILRNIIQNRKIEDFMILRDIIIETDSIKYTQDKAKEYVALAKKGPARNGEM